jgi:hypothetical protein
MNATSKNMSQGTSSPSRFQRFYELATIHDDTFQEDPLNINRINLEFTDGRKWAIRDLVFPVSNSPSNDHSSLGLECLPIGATVSVVTPYPQFAPPGHMNAV